MVGVSYQTVSRVINDKPNVDPDTRQRVLEAMNVLKYRPSRHARALAQQDVKTIGLLVPDLVNPFFPEVSNGVIEAAVERGWQVTIRTTGNSSERDVLRETMRSTDAVVGYFNRADAPLQETGWDVPVVALDHEGAGHSFGGVRIEVDRAVREGLEHLLDRGHTEICMLDCSTSCDRYRRREAFVQVLGDAGRPPPARGIRTTDQSIDGAAAATHVLVDENPNVTAIFAFNDLVAIGALRALRARGIGVPADCAVLGFDGLAVGQLVTPALTSLHIDTRRLGTLAADQVETLLAAPSDAPAGETTLLKPQLVVGEST